MKDLIILLLFVSMAMISFTFRTLRKELNQNIKQINENVEAYNRNIKQINENIETYNKNLLKIECILKNLNIKEK